MTQALPNNSEAIERRIDRAVVGTIAIDPRKGMAVDSMGQAMEVAKLMSISDCAVPKHLRGNPGACLAVAIQGYEWSINPFAIANKSYEVNDRLVYESALYQAVVTKRAPIKGRMRYTFSGEGETRQCKVTAELSDGSGIVDYESPKFSRIQPKNSPLWKHDPDQQLIYYSVRAFARRHFADVMLGIQTVDEIQDSPPEDRERDTLPKTRAAKILEDISGAPVSEGQTIDPDGDTIDDLAREGETFDAATGEVRSPAAQSEGTPSPINSGTVAAPSALATHEQFVEAMNESAMDAGAMPSAVGDFLKGYALRKACVGQIEKQSAEWRKAALDEFSRSLAQK